VTTLSIAAGAAPRDRVAQVGLFSLVGMVAAAQLSIAVSEILLWVALLCWFLLHLSRRERLDAPAFFWPLVGYAMLTLLAAGFSQNPVISVPDCKQLTLFLIVPLVYDFARGLRARNFLTVVITVGAVTSTPTPVVKDHDVVTDSAAAGFSAGSVTTPASQIT